MAGISRFAVSLKTIKKYFENTQRQAFSKREIEGIFEDNKALWNLPISMKIEKFIQQLVEKGEFKRAQIDFPNSLPVIVYYFGDATIQEIVSSMYPKGYLSHYSAISIWGFTEQIPKIVYLTVEQSKKHTSSVYSLKQEAIDEAFRKPQRISESIFTFDGFDIVLLKGKNTGNLGVRSSNKNYNIKITDPERTLIDSVVRPNYAGGVNEVLKAFKVANRNGTISINKLISYLKKMNFIYPYHQAIGFYLERSGAYKQEHLDRLKEIEMPFKFYLTYNMREMDFSETWNLYYPKGL